MEKNVNLIKFSQGKIDIAFNENLSKNFVRNLSEKLLEWTSKRWVITLAQGKSQKTFEETKTIKKNQQLEDEKKNDLYKKFKGVALNEEFTLQKLVNRSMDKYLKDEEYKKSIVEYDELQVSGSNF